MVEVQRKDHERQFPASPGNLEADLRWLTGAAEEFVNGHFDQTSRARSSRARCGGAGVFCADQSPTSGKREIVVRVLATLCASTFLYCMPDVSSWRRSISTRRLMGACDRRDAKRTILRARRRGGSDAIP